MRADALRAIEGSLLAVSIRRGRGQQISDQQEALHVLRAIEPFLKDEAPAVQGEGSDQQTTESRKDNR